MNKRHPGVSVISRDRDGKTTWYLRWRDGGKRREKRASDHKAERLRQAIRLSKRLRRTGPSQPILDAWLSCAQDLEPSSERSYLGSLERFLELSGLETTWDLNRDTLREYRARLADLDHLHPETLNADLRRMSAILHQMRRADLTPDLHKDDVGDTLRRFKVRREPVRPYSPKFLRQIFAAADEVDLTSNRRFRYLVEFVLLSGLRPGEAFAFTPEWVKIDRGVIEVPSMKTSRGRVVDMSISPRLAWLCSEWAPQIARWTKPYANKVRQRLRPRWTWQMLRKTCASYLICSDLLPTWRAAKQLGHSEQVADNYYRGVITSIPSGVTTLESAMGFGSKKS